MKQLNKRQIVTQLQSYILKKNAARAIHTHTFVYNKKYKNFEMTVKYKIVASLQQVLSVSLSLRTQQTNKVNSTCAVTVNTSFPNRGNSGDNVAFDFIEPHMAE